MIEHRNEWPVYSAEAIEQVAELLRAGRSFDYGYGPELQELERLFSESHEGRHSLSFNSATSALLAAYAALGIGSGDEVVVPSYSFLATASPLLLLEAIPVLADAGGDDGNVSVSSIQARTTARTRAVAVTHLFGHPCDLPSIAEFCDSSGVALIEDCSHAHGSTLGGRSVGTFGDASVYSLGSHKLVSGGMGGMLLTPHDELHDRACLIGHFKHRSALTVIDPALRELADFGLGANLRMAPTAAVLASSHMRMLDRLVMWKRRNAEALLAAFENLPGVRGTPRAPDASMGAWHDIVLAVDASECPIGRDALIDALRERGVKARVPSTRPLHRSSIFKGKLPSGWLRYDSEVRHTAFSLDPACFPVCERLDASWLSLPGMYFNDEAGAHVGPYVEAIRDALEELQG